MAKKIQFKSIYPDDTNTERTNEKKVTYNSVEDFIPVSDASDLISYNMLTGNNKKKVRSRQMLFKTWQSMEKDSVISSALKIHSISALGGHESKGDIIFIEDAPIASEQDKKLNDELRRDLSDLFNKMAFQVTYNALAFGDAYCRPYCEKGKGIVDAIHDETVHPRLIIPFEQGGITKGYLAGTSKSPENYQRIN